MAKWPPRKPRVAEGKRETCSQSLRPRRKCGGFKLNPALSSPSSRELPRPEGPLVLSAQGVILAQADVLTLSLLLPRPVLPVVKNSSFFRGFPHELVLSVLFPLPLVSVSVHRIFRKTTLACLHGGG